MKRLGRVDVQKALVVGLVAIGMLLSAPYFPERFSDVRAFYCAGQAVLAHADPYREHPLHECERRVTAPGLSALRNDVAVPAPFPGFVLALFALLAELPFPVALLFWNIAACAALIFAIVLLARVTANSLRGVGIVVGFPALTVALPLGQVTPFVLCALAAAAYLLRAQRPRWAALAALGTMLDPHVGLPVVLGLAIGSARSRLVVIAGSLGLIALGLVVSSPPHEIEYVRAVVPAHALANVADSMQFSATNFAYVAGASTAFALIAGSVWYVAALVAGLVVAARLRTRLGTPASILIPPAFAVFGGTHTHLAQLAMAIPAFLLVCSAARGAQRTVFTLVAFVAAIPWLEIGAFPWLFPATATLGIVYAQTMRIGPQAVRLGAASFVTLVAIFVTIVRSQRTAGLIDAHVVGNPLAEVAWRIAVLARNVPPEPWYLFAKAPTVIAFLMFFIVLIHAAFARQRTAGQC